VFDHHHLFSLEHFISNQLTEKYSKYQQTISRLTKLSLERRLTSLYAAVEDLREKLAICVQKQERDFQLRRLEAYRREVRLVRDQRDEETHRERDAVKEILVVWKKLKEARKQQGYRNTSVKLVIRRVRCGGLSAYTFLGGSGGGTPPPPLEQFV
jgi:coiled-coil and C2 domain-containing protein 2A